MIHYIWPLLLIVASNCVYQICAKGIPSQMNVYASMAVTYAVAAIFSAAAFFLSAKDKNIVQQFALTNWATVLLGVVITGLEVGFIFAYKAGWKVSALAVVSNAFLAAALVFVGFFVYRESITPSKLFGIAVCLAGLWFINR